MMQNKSFLILFLITRAGVNKNKPGCLNWD